MKSAIVLGGTEDHIRLIEILKNKGYYTILIDYYENPAAKDYADEHIRESTLEHEKILLLASNIKPELVIATCIDQALLTMAYVCEKLNLPCHISFQTAIALTNKTYMKRKFAEHDIPTAKFIIHENENVYKDIELNFPIVVKPADSNSSKGITKVFSNNELEESIKYAYSFSRSKKVVVEEYIEGEEYSVDVAIYDCEPSVVMVTKNIKLRQNENNFTIVQSLYPATHDSMILEKIREIAKKIACSYEIVNGPLLIQLIVNGSNISVVEFSSRIGGGSKHHFILKMTGFDILNWFVNVLEGKLEKPEYSHKFEFGCVNYIYAGSGIIKEFVGFEEMKNAGIIEQFFFYKTIMMSVHNHISSADRPAGYMVVDNQIEQFILKINKANSEIKILDDNGEDLIIHEY